MKLSRLALAIAVLPGFALAAEPYTAEPLVITSGRQTEPLRQVTAATTLFTRKDIERLQVRSVAELLERVPGSSLVQSGGRGSQTGLFLRGTSPAQTLVLVDGQRIGSASSGTPSLEFLAIDQIERVEVTRGPRSSLYGSDAIGGVVQIFTRQGEPGLNPRLRIAAGSHNTFERSLGLSGGDDVTTFNLGASLDDTRGIDRTRDNLGGDADRDAFRKRAVSFSLGHQFNDSLEAGLNVLDQRGQAEYDDANAFASGRPSDDFLLSSTSGYLQARFNDIWTSRLSLGHSEDKRDTSDPTNPFGNFTFNTYRDSATWQNTLQLTEQHQLLAGLDWYEDKLHSTTAFNETERWNQAAFIQHRYQGEWFGTELGLRHDKNEQFGSENSWNAALRVPVGTLDEVLVSYGEGFRAPTFNDLYFPDFCSSFGCFANANPDLKPERSKTYELQWRHRLANDGSFDVSLYRTDIRDMITLDENFIPQNVATARINGFEASWNQTLFGWHSRLSVGLIDPRDRDSGHTLQRRAKRTFSLDLDRELGSFSAGLGWQLVSQRFDDAANTIEVPGYGVLDVRAGWQMTSELRWEAKVDNLLDRDFFSTTYGRAEGRYGYREEGRSALLSLSWTPQL